MIKPDTLKVAYIFDWEQAGYLPPEMECELWCAHGEHNWGYHAFFDNELIEREIELITP